MAAEALTSVHAEVVDGLLELAGNGSAAVPTGANEALIGSGISLPCNDIAEDWKFQRKKSSMLAVHGGEQTWLLPCMFLFLR